MSGCNTNDETRRRQEQNILAVLKRIKNKLIVMSGKGGVGKSSVAVNLAVGLADRGFRVGLMDVDLHGPSVPQMLGITREMMAPATDKIQPVPFSENLKVISIECMLENVDTAVIWRGPLKISAIRQFIADVEWGELDYLIVDAPPGTGDEPLTVAQTIADAEAVIITTPQAVSLRDVRKSVQFCRQTNMKIRGIVENMSGFVCPECGTMTDLFKTGGGRRTAEEMDLPFLGCIPIIPGIVTACDAGTPAVRVSEELKQCFEPVLDGVLVKKNGPTQNKIDKEALNMKIAIPLAQKKLSLHFGHCEEFALVEADENEKKIIKTETIPAPEHQPGLLPRWLHERGANVIIAGGMGSRAQALFAENGIQVVVGASAEEPEKIAADYLNGFLATGNNICDH